MFTCSVSVFTPSYLQFSSFRLFCSPQYRLALISVVVVVVYSFLFFFIQNLITSSHHTDVFRLGSLGARRVPFSRIVYILRFFVCLFIS